MNASRMACIGLLALGGSFAPGLAALAADPLWPAGDPTWTQADPSWLRAHWKWTNGPAPHHAAPSAQVMVPAMEQAIVRVDMQTALASAAAHGDLLQVKTLMAQGANVNLRDGQGYTALTWAAQRGQANVVSYLLDHYANPNPADRGGYTPLMWATQEGHIDSVKALLAHGANPYVQDPRGVTPLTLAQISGNAALVGEIRTAMQTSQAARRPLPPTP